MFWIWYQSVWWKVSDHGALWTTTSLLLITDFLRLGLPITVRDLSIGQIELFNRLQHLKPFNCGQAIYSNNWKHFNCVQRKLSVLNSLCNLLVCKQGKIVSFKSVTFKLFAYKSYKHTHTHTHTHTYIYIYIYILRKKQSVVFYQTCLDNDFLPIYLYILSSTDRLFRSIRTLQCG